MTLKEYIENEIIARYDNFDAAHQRDHVLTVIDQALTISEGYGLDKDMLYAAAAFHDTGLVAGRKTHHLESGKIIREDPVLPQFFSQEQIETIAQAAEDHRASSDHEPRSVYGRVIAEADRVIDPMTIIRRTIQYGLSNYPEKEKEEQYERMLEHIHEKYAEGGYLKLWIKESPNAQRLEQLREIIRDEARLREIFDSMFDTLR